MREGRNGYDRVTQSYAGGPSYAREGGERVSASYGGGGESYRVAQSGRSMDDDFEEEQHDLDSFIDSGH